MKKVFLSKNGYAMTELLIASSFILGLFAVLFVNFLPLMTEYENREYYNNVTSKYASFYLRKMYINALTDEKTGLDLKAALNTSIAKDNYFKVYSNKENLLCASLLPEDVKKCKNIISEYGIEEVIVTDYKIDNLKSTYPKTGTFYKYINYLPKYKSEDSGTELYRLILKTKDYGYATSAILSNYKTNSKCFVGSLKQNGEIEIDRYLYDEKDCSEKVVLPNQRITIKDNNGQDINGIVTSIGKRAFLGTGITNISYPTTVTEIKDEAFKDTKLEEFRFNTTLTHVGKRAFSGTNISEITIPSMVYIDDYAFSNNKNLINIIISPGITSLMNKDNIMSQGLFENCGNGEVVSVSFPSSLEYIGDETFSNTYVTNLDFGSLNLKGINKDAFSTSKEKKVSNFNLPNTLTYIGDNAFKNNNISIVTIPKEVKHIDSYAFYKSGIKSLVINSDKDLVVKNSAFKDNDIMNINLGNKIVKIEDYAFSDNKNLKNVTLPLSLKELGNGSFMNTSLGDKENSFKSYKEGFTWCKVLFDETKCDVSGGSSLIKISYKGKVKYINIEVGGLLD